MLLALRDILSRYEIRDQGMYNGGDGVDDEDENKGVGGWGGEIDG